jgi:hypothetical protein
VKKSIEDNKFKIQDGCNHRGHSRLHSLNFQNAIFNPILSQTLSGDPRPPAGRDVLLENYSTSVLHRRWD